MDHGQPFGVAPLNAKVCPLCTSGDLSIGRVVIPPPLHLVPYISWCTMARCPRCSHEWYVCRECKSVRGSFSTQQQLKNHAFKYHKKKTGGNELLETNITGKREKAAHASVICNKRPALEAHPPPKGSSTTRIVMPPPVSSTMESFQLSRNNLGKAKDCCTSDNSRSSDEYYYPMDYSYGTDQPEPDIEETPSKKYGGIPTVVLASDFSRKESTEYFGHNYHVKRGLAYVVSRSFYDNQIAPEDIPQEDLKMCTDLSLLVKTLSMKQRDMLGDFLEIFYKRIDEVTEQWRRLNGNLEERLLHENWCDHCNCRRCCRKKKNGNKRNHHAEAPIRLPPLPKNALSIRQKISRGGSAFLTLLPHPCVQDLGDGHVYVLPSDCIKHFIAHGNVPMNFDMFEESYPYSQFNCSPRGAEVARKLARVTKGKIINRRHFNVSFLEWKDDCESAKSNKTSKHNLWLFTITIFSDSSNKDSPLATYPVAIGPKGKNHNEIEKIIGDDIEKMRTTALPTILGWRANQPPIPCTFSADLFMSLGDQPERRGGNVLQLGTSRHHARWRHACDFRQLINVLPACDSCFRKMEDCDSLEARTNPLYNRDSWKNNSCNRCTNWARDLENPLLQFERTKESPTDYKLGAVPGEGKLSPIVLTYLILEKVTDLAFEMVSSGKWTKVQGITYLCDNCINEKFARISMARAINLLNLNNARDDAEDDINYRQLLLQQSKNPERFQQMDLPSLYKRGVPLNTFLDTPMHLLLLGIVKAAFWRIASWANRRGRKPAFIAFAQEMLTELDDLKLSWLIFVPKTFSKEWGGWVSKNYGSLLRVALWVYGPLLTVPDDPIYTDPVEDPNTWKVPQYRGWLKARGLDSLGNKPDLQPRVMDYILGPPHLIPPIKKVLYGKPPEMWEMLKSMVLLVTTLFQEKVYKHTRDIIDLRIRLFLTRFERFEAPMRSNENRVWLKSYNFLCLLNLPEAVGNFGPCRRWFEGKWLGERYVSTVKDERERCPPKNVHLILMRNLQVSKCILDLKAQENGASRDHLLLNTKVFDSRQALEDHYSKRIPLPAIITVGRFFYCLYYSKGKSVGKKITAVTMMKKDMPDGDQFMDGLKYWEFTLTGSEQNLTKLVTVDYAVLLPMRGTIAEGIYTVITKNWSTEMFGEYNYKEECLNYTAQESENDKADAGYRYKTESDEERSTSGWI